MMLLTVAEIKHLIQFAGLALTDDSLAHTDEDESEIMICDCPAGGVRDCDTGEARRYTHIAYFYEYPDEGVLGLGPELHGAGDEKGGG